MELTNKQQAVFDFIKDYRNRCRQSPTYEEIRRHFGFVSLNSVRKHLQQLEGKGYINTPWANQKRAVRIADEKLDAPDLAVVRLPFLGTVTAGEPLEAPETPESIAVPEALLRRGEHFVLRVRGESMLGDGIHDGDLLVVLRGESAWPGQTVVALVDGEATVKRFYRRGKRIELRPANADYAPVVVDEAAVRIRGVVVALFRKYV